MNMTEVATQLRQQALALECVPAPPPALVGNDQDRQTDREQAMLNMLLLHARFVLSFDERGVMQMREIPPDAFITTCKKLPKMIDDCYRGDDMKYLPELISAAANKLAGRPREA